MFTYRVRLLRLFGFDVYVDASWLLLALLVVWSLAAGVFPVSAPGLPTSTYIWMGVFAAAGLFVSIVLHEVSHSLVARQFAMPIRGITLFIFGGVAEMTDEPTSPRGEFLMAVAGPAASAGLGVIFLLASSLTAAVAPVTAVLGYLALINFILAAFNVLPAYPLDGGRMLRAALWGWRKDILWASRIAAISGEGFAFLLIALGVFQIVGGNFLGGLWMGLIGLFLHGAANSSYRQVLAREALKGQAISRFMTRAPVAVPAGVSVQALVDDYIYRLHHKRFPVVEDGALVGCVGTTDVAEFDRGRWPSLAVREAMKPCRPDEVATPDTDALEAMGKIQRLGGGPLMVVEGRRLVGLLSIRDLMEFLAVKLELEGRRPDLLRAGPAADRPARG